jgi:hypothetical protein
MFILLLNTFVIPLIIQIFRSTKVVKKTNNAKKVFLYVPNVPDFFC